MTNDTNDTDASATQSAINPNDALSLQEKQMSEHESRQESPVPQNSMPKSMSPPEIEAQLKAIDDAAAAATAAVATATAAVTANMESNIDPQFAEELIQATSSVIDTNSGDNHINDIFGIDNSVAVPGTKPSGSKKKVRREYLPEEIPEEYREKPQHSYSHLIATALRARAPVNGMSLSDIYRAIQDIFPYYEYCPHGWQNSVRHNLSSNKAFRKVSKEGKGWLWGIDEEYFLEKERQKKKAAAAKSKAAAISQAQQAARQQNQQLQQQLQQQQQQQQQLQLQLQQQQLLLLQQQQEQQQQSLGGDLSDLVKQHQPKKEKTIAELAREIEVHHPNYSALTRESLSASISPPGGLARTAVGSSLSGSTRIERQLSVTEFHSVTPSPNSIQAQLAANLQKRQYSTSAPPLVQPSLAAGQSTFRMAKSANQASAGTLTAGNLGRPSLQHQTSVPQMRVQRQGSYQQQEGQSSAGGSAPKSDATLAAVQSAGLSLSQDTIKALGLLQQKIQTQIQNMGIGTGANSALLTNALAVAIAQAVKTGGANSIASLLNGKNPAQLTQLLQTALAAMSKKKATNVPTTTSTASTSATATTTASTSASHSTVPSVAPTSAVSTSSALPMVEMPDQTATTNTASTHPSQSHPEPQAIPRPLPTTAAPISLTASTATGTSVTARPTTVPARPPPSAATIAQLLAQASKISNPSPSMKAALEQLRAHATKLNVATGSTTSTTANPETTIAIAAGSSNETSKRPSDESIEILDNTAVKTTKTG